MINLKINGAELTINNATDEQILSVIRALGNESNQKQDSGPADQPTPIKLKIRKRKSLNTNIQEDSAPRPINEFFDIETAINLKCIKKSFDTGRSLDKSSVQLRARQEVIWTFADNNNQPLDRNSVIRNICESLSITPSAASNYVSQSVRLGILTKYTRKNQTYYFLSAWFLSQSELSNEKQ